MNSVLVCKRILIGGSAGSLEQLMTILKRCLNLNFPPIVIAMHLSERGKCEQLRAILQTCTNLKVRPAKDNMYLAENTVYLASGNYHILLTEEGQKMHLYDDEPYHFSKPSIDILFYSCIGSEAKSTKALLLSGANNDGSESLRALFESGADCKAINPEECQFPAMPKAAEKLGLNQTFISLSKVAQWMTQPIVN